MCVCVRVRACVCACACVCVCAQGALNRKLIPLKRKQLSQSGEGPLVLGSKVTSGPIRGADIVGLIFVSIITSIIRSIDL